MGRQKKKSQPKRQTQLAFNPVSSSPSGVQWSPGSGSERQATMRYKDPSNSSVISNPIPKTPAIFKASQTSEIGSVSSDEEPINMPSSRRKSNTKPIIVDDGSESDDVVPSSPLKRRRLRRGSVEKATPSQKTTPEEENDSSESDGILVSSPPKRRKRNHEPELETPLRGSGGRADRERLDIEEDVEDLRDSTTLKTRTRGKAANSAGLKRREQLEALRRKRAKEKAPQVVSSSEGEPEGDSGESSEEGDSEEEGTEEEEQQLWYGSGKEEDSDIEPPAPEDLDKYDEDFVEEDDEGNLGVPPDLSDIPFEFTRHRYKRLRDHFRDVVEWMVHNKLNPAFPRDDPVYRAAFSKVNDEVMGLAGSQLVSSAWNIDFKRALEARPGIEVTIFPIAAGHACDACNKSNHPASFDIRLEGEPYLLETLEPVSDDDSGSDDDEKSEAPGNVDREGNPIPDSSTHFYLGRHCKTKATMAHTLIHWRFHLNEWIVDYLQRKGVFSDSKILERERWSHKRRTKYANETVDSMEESKEIDKLWRDFNINVKAAREAKESRW